MKKENRKNFSIAVCMLAAFVLWTVAVCVIDVRPIGPLGSTVGFAAVNRFVHKLTGVHMALYTLTDWLGLVPLCFILGFALLGLVQWVRRKQLSRVDHSIFVLGGFYVMVMAIYIFFEVFPVNYRPVLIGGVLEVSYPSSTTLLVMCVMPTAILQFRARIQSCALRRVVVAAIAVFTLFMVIGRLLSGVHWVTDIIGGAILSAGLVMLYRAVTDLIQKMQKPTCD